MAPDQASNPTTIAGGGTYPKQGESVTYLSDRKRYYSATELGRIYDPIMFLPTYDACSRGSIPQNCRGAKESPRIKPDDMPAAGAPWPLVQVGKPLPALTSGVAIPSASAARNTPKFNQPTGHVPADMPATHAARLLDLFHAGKSRSTDGTLREGPVVRIEGHVNINTASRDALPTRWPPGCS